MRAVAENRSVLQAKAAIIESLRAKFRRYRESDSGWKSYDSWFEKPINNARLNTVASCSIQASILSAV